MTRETNENGTLNPYVVHGGEIRTGDFFGYKVIAVVHDQYFWAAYRGLTDWSDERVAAEGDKISYEVACSLFPTIAGTIPHYNT
jgi:hypothetical protein